LTHTQWRDIEGTLFSIVCLALDDPMSLVKRMGQFEEEDEHDMHVCNDNPGAEDVEEESNDDLALVMFEAN